MALKMAFLKKVKVQTVALTLCGPVASIEALGF
jgi:hypothetical protein